MSKSKASGYHLTNNDASMVLGQVARGDRDHDIAAWFGVNQGRIAEVKDGSHGTPALAKAEDLPPRGPPGVKGRRLRYTVGKISEALEAGDTQKAKDLIAQGVSRYDENEA